MQTSQFLNSFMTKLSPDWTAVTKNVNIEQDLEVTPLQILTNTKLEGHDQAQLYFESIGRIKLEFRYRRFSFHYCGYRLFPGHLPVETIKTWTISRTKEALTILCNGVEVLNLVYAEYDKYCSRTWSKSSTKIKFENGDSASDYMQFLSQGMAKFYVMIF